MGCIDYDVSNETENESSVECDGVEMTPWRRIVVFTADKLENIIKNVRQISLLKCPHNPASCLVSKTCFAAFDHRRLTLGGQRPDHQTLNMWGCNGHPPSVTFVLQFVVF